MSLSLSCTCGARFEVEETFAGQEISCPECHQAIAVPARSRQPVRTSGFAVASLVLSLVGAFTLVLTLLAVVLGGIGLLSISRNRGRVTGAGYAVFGIVAGLVFSGLFLFALLMPELFGDGLFQEELLGMQSDRGGPLEIVREADGFAITRPTPHWRVARPQLQKQISPDCKLLLIQSARSAYLEVHIDHLAAGHSMEEYRDQTVDAFSGRGFRGFGNAGPRLSNFKSRHSKRLEPLQGKEVLELFFDVHVDNLPVTYLIRLIGPAHGDQVYVLRGWAHRRMFPRSEPEICQAFNSFRLLDE